MKRAKNGGCAHAPHARTARTAPHAPHARTHARSVAKAQD